MFLSEMSSPCQHATAYLAFIWLFLAAASLAVIGSGRTEGIKEFLGEKKHLYFSFYLNYMKFFFLRKSYYKSTIFTVESYKLLTSICPSNLQATQHYHINTTFLFLFYRNIWKLSITSLNTFYKRVNLGKKKYITHVNLTHCTLAKEANTKPQGRF